MKKLARNVVVNILGRQVRLLIAKNNTKIVCVVGSIGKTSTKLAIARVLESGFRVKYQEGNYNDLVTVPLIFFGEELPSLFNPFAWLSLFRRNKAQLKKPYPYDVVVVELGSDGPGQIKEFKRYLRAEIAVVTAITPEHMEFFESLDDVAKEELTVTELTDLVIANNDLCSPKHLDGLQNLLTYGTNSDADFKPEQFKLDKFGSSLTERYSALAAAAVGSKLGLSKDQISKGMENIKPVPGRMQTLSGINGSLIIDDSYNSSPDAVKMALDTLYGLPATQKIAVLGNMNELGNFSKKAHEEVGKYCDPSQLELVVTIGPDANKYLAPAASTKDCKVHSFDSPYDAGEFLKPVLKKGSVILVKGSQNRVFAEETIKSLLADPSDVSKLVRQSPQWTKIKSKAFTK